MKPTRQTIDPFLCGYLDAALFTTDTSPPGGCDYVESGRADEMFSKLPSRFVKQAQKDCAAFVTQNGTLLDEAGDPGRNGSDFWFTRNRHGLGYRDRDYPYEVSGPLTDAAHKFGECYLAPEDIGQRSERG